MLKYFKSEKQLQFLRYYVTFNNYYHFVSHTGVYLSDRWLKDLQNKFKLLEIALKEAKDKALEGDFEMLQQVKMGKYKTWYYGKSRKT